MHLAERDVKVDLNIAISRCQINVLTLTSQLISDLYTYKNTIQYIVQNLVDARGYVDGCGYESEIISVTSLEAASYVFGVHVGVLATNRADTGLDSNRIGQMALDNPPLGRALADLRHAIREPYDTAFYCYRAVESIMQHFRGFNDSEKGIAWQAMRDALNIDRQLIDQLQRMAAAQRHGELHPVTDEQRVLAMSVCNAVLKRFVILIQIGAGALDREQFPLLEA